MDLSSLQKLMLHFRDVNGSMRIAAVFPDLLGTYGDRNAEILAARARWRSIGVEFTDAVSSEPLPAADIYCIGGGEDGPQVLAARRLRQDPTFRSAVDDGAVVLAVCAGYQIVGKSFPDAKGGAVEGIGLLDVTTTKGAGPRAVGEIIVTVPTIAEGGLGVDLLTGFENHGGITSLGAGVRALGTASLGVGNGPAGGTEGAWNGRVVGTYLHGPVLSRNPALADLLLSWATGRTELDPLDDYREDELRRERLGALNVANGRGASAPKP
jgi:CobQ-like glutamine amidotransferase family enzyme